MDCPCEVALVLNKASLFIVRGLLGGFRQLSEELLKES